MGLATLLNLPTNLDLVTQFTFANQDSHFKIASAIGQQKKQFIPTYPLDPLPPTQQGTLDWGRNHQNAHDAQNQILGIQGQDITTLGQLIWQALLAEGGVALGELSPAIQQHFIEHYLAETQLGVT